MSISPVYDRINHMLGKRQSTGNFRRTARYRKPGAGIDCSTNSYLGLHENREVADAAALLANGTLYGGLASRLVAETSGLYSLLESELAQWEGTEAALLFSSGYAANVGIISAVCGRSTEVFSDRLNHASIYDGIRLAGCRLSRYRHGDMADLERRLSGSAASEKVIVTDTVFSMDGDTAPLVQIVELANEYRAFVIVDEAHATGIWGERGSGFVEACGVGSSIDVRMGTLSKAVAGLGGYVAVSRELRDYFVNFSRSLIYSTGLPHSVLAHNLAAVRHLRSHPEYGKRLLESAGQFRRELHNIGFTTQPSSTQIIPCYCNDANEAVALSAYLKNCGIIVPAIRPPTVPEGTARVRFSWSLLLGGNDAMEIVDHLKKWRCGHH